MVSTRRDPADLARLVASATGLALAALLRRQRPDSLRNISGDIVSLAARLPDWLQIVVVGTTQLAAVAVAIGVIVLLIVRRRWNIMATVLGSALVAAALTAWSSNWIARTAPVPRVQLPRPTWIIGPTFPSAAYLAAIVAAVVAASPIWTRSWRRAAWVCVGVVAFSRILTAATVPVGIGASILVGMTVGSAALFLIGIPRLRPTTEAITDALGSLGLRLSDIEPVGDGSTGHFSYNASDDQGRPLEVVLVDRHDRDADLFARITRAIRVKDVDADQAGLSPTRIVEHAALVGMLAASGGAPVRTVRAVGSTPDEDGVLVYDNPPTKRLLDLDEGEFTDELLRETWQALSELHDQRIAHRRASLAHAVVDSDGHVLWSGMRYSTIGAPDRLIALDVAELLTSTAIKVGVERAVSIAVSTCDRDILTAALPLLQPVILSASTKRALSTRKALLGEVREELQSQLDVEPVELAQLKRITAGRLIAVALGTILIYVGLSFASDFASTAEALRGFDWSHLVPLIVLTALTFPAQALSMQGAVPISLPLGQATEVVFAQTLLNRFTPANAGGMAMRLRYLQRVGVDLDVGAASLGLSSAAGGVAQVLMMVVFAVWAGSSGSLNISLPTSLIAPAIAIVLALSGVIYLTPFGRRLWSTKLLPSVQKTVPIVRDLLRSPGKLAMLLFSNIAMKVFTIATFAIAAKGMGLDFGFAQIGILYLTANTVASAAPTPGGLGAMEAALTAALTSAGAPPAEALSAVLVFRLVTFWLPIPFSALSLGRLRRAGIV